MRRHLVLLAALVIWALAQPASWWELLDAIKFREGEFNFWSERPPMACWLCGEPLHRAPQVDTGASVELYCPFDGWQYPRDWIRDQRL